MIVLYMILALLMGFCVATQGAINSSLASKIGTGETLLVNTILVGVGAVITFFILSGPSRLSWSHLTRASLLEYAGGILGFCIILLAIVLFPRLGAGLTLSLAITAQLVTALFIDHYGFMGVPEHAVSLPRLAGVALMVGGVALIKLF